VADEGEGAQGAGWRSERDGVIHGAEGDAPVLPIR
jgi:hypothetical protein